MNTLHRIAVWARGDWHDRGSCATCDRERTRRMDRMREAVIAGFTQGAGRPPTAEELADIDAQYETAGATHLDRSPS